MSKLDRFKRRGATRGPLETDAEQALWSNLYRIPLEGTHFRRQVEIGPYRADFGLLRLKLLIEIDGGIHDGSTQRQKDALRDEWLVKEGYRVIRFSNHRVSTDMNSVLSAIELAVESQKRALNAQTVSHPTPALSRRPSPSRGG